MCSNITKVIFSEQNPLKYVQQLLLSDLSKLPYEVTPDQAMSHEEVRNRLEASSLALRAATDKVLNSIVSSLDNIP